MIRIGEVIKTDSNPVMNVSSGYEEVVQKLADLEYASDEKKLLACLIISQTEKQYKKYLINVLNKLKKIPFQDLINDWQESNFAVNDYDFKDLLSKDEYKLLKDKDVDYHLEQFEDKYSSLFDDGLNNAFYPTKKKGMVYLRRLINNYLKDRNNLSHFELLIVHFITAQLLISWESSCIHLGLMIIEDRSLDDMAKWFNKTWPIYTV